VLHRVSAGAGEEAVVGLPDLDLLDVVVSARVQYLDGLYDRRRLEAGEGVRLLAVVLELQARRAALDVRRSTGPIDAAVPPQLMA